MAQSDDIRLIQNLLGTIVNNGETPGFTAPSASGKMDDHTLRVLDAVLRRNSSMKSLNLQSTALPAVSTLKDLMFKAHLTSPPPVYGRDVHYSLTEALAIAAGFDYVDAMDIAVANQKVDTDPKTTPVPEASYEYLKRGDKLGIQRRKDWHFTNAARRAELRAIYLKSGSLEDLGKYMHAFQDQYSHFGLGPGIGQIGSKVDKNGEPTEWSMNTEEWHAADYTSSNVEKANKMAKDTYEELCDAVGHFAAKGTIKLRYYPINYHEISDLVDQFNKAPEEDPPNQKNTIAGQIRTKVAGHQARLGPIK